MSAVTGKVTKVRMDFSAKKSNGEGTFKAHGLQVDVNGEEKKFIIAANSPAGKFMPKLNIVEGDTVTVEVGGKFNSVMKVSKGSGFKKKFEKTPFDNSGVVKGMVLNNAVQIAIHQAAYRAVSAIDTSDIIAAAKTVLEARGEVDKLVEAHLKGNSTAEADPFGDTDDADQGEADEESPF